MTDLETAMMQSERAKDERRIDYVVRHILENFAPEDPRRRNEFDRALFHLVNVIWNEAQAPLFKHLSAITAHFPIYPPMKS